jgi:hypothetical protein
VAPPPRRPAALIVVHKVLIGSAAALGALMTALGLAQRAWAIAGVSALVALALALYFRTIDRRYGGGG